MSKFSKLKSLWVGLGVIHLAFVVCGAAHVNFTNLFSQVGLFKLGTGLDVYSELSGAKSSYGFFSPGVGSQLRARFEVTDQNNDTRMVSLESQQSREADLRVGNIIGNFWNAVKDEKLRRSFAASWAAKIFGRCNDAETVTVRLEAFQLVSTKGHLAGKRSFWKPFYRAKFLKSSDVKKNG